MHRLIQQLRSTALLGKYAELTDGQLLDGLVAGRAEGALEVLVRRHAQMVWAVCRRVLGNHHDAEDAFQATFLVFVRKAASISARAKVGNWLYGVAHQTALDARRNRAKRQMRDMNMAAMPEPAMTEQAGWNDLQAVFDEELSRMPEKYRTAIVLCDLEGRTRSDVARQLGLPEGTMAGRLARARKMLAKRIQRTRSPGVFSSGALATLLGQNAACAAVPNSLTNLTIQAAKLVVAGQNAAGVATAGAVALTEGVVQAMFISRCKKLAMLLFMPLACTFLVADIGQPGPNRIFPGMQPPVAAAISAPALPSPAAAGQGQDERTKQQEKPESKPPSGFNAATVEAWTKAGAQVGWMGTNQYGSLGFEMRPDGLAAAMPAFRFSRWEEKLLAGLPPPVAPFGLDLSLPQVTDAGLKELAGLNRLHYLNLRGTRVTDARLKELTGLKSLQALELKDTQVTDVGLKELAGLNSLHYLHLWGTPVTDVGLKELAGLKRLQSLDLARTGVTDAGLKELAGLKNLQWLSLFSTGVTDAGLKELAGLKNLRTLDLGRTQVTNAVLKELAGLKRLQSLSLNETQFTDIGLKQLVGLNSLQTLDLGRTQVTDPGLKELAGIKSLQKLDLWGTKVTDAGLKELAGLKNLQSLNLNETQVTDAGLKELAGLKNLQGLGLSHTPVTDVGLKELAGLNNLQSLFLAFTQVTDAGLKELAAGHKNLQTLDLIGTEVTDAGLKELAGLKNLQKLFLDLTQVADAGLKELASIKSLQWLYLDSTKVTDAGLKELDGIKSLQSLNLGGTQVTDAGLKELDGLNSLQHLNLRGTWVTDAGVAALRKSLPGCRIGR